MSTLARLSNRPEYVFRPQNLFRRIVLRPFYRGKNAVVTLKNGCRIRVREGEFIGNQILNTRCHDPALSELLWRLIRKGDSCVDVGANIGVITLLMADRCGETGRCLAFEADPGIFERLRENIGMNGFSRVTLIRAAVSDKIGTLSFQPPEEFNCGLGRIAEERASGSFEVPSIPLDPHLASIDRVRVVKIDVEGHELQVLRGMQSALESKKIEHLVFEEHGGPGAESLKVLRRAGYAIFRLSRGLRGPRLLPVERTDAEDMEPNFVAALDPAPLQLLLRRPGWNVF
jgi:FkbM family methyltransferase